jgi:hypothetical protein
MSKSTGSHGAAYMEKWKFEPSYSGVRAQRLRTPGASRTPVTMLDATLTDRASFPSVVSNTAGSVDTFRTQTLVKHSPNAHAFVTGKICEMPHQDAQLERAPTRLHCSKHVFDQDGSLLINMHSTTTMMPSRAAAQDMGVTRRGLGSVPPMGQMIFPGRPFSTHEPGRHRFFLGDVRTKIG